MGIGYASRLAGAVVFVCLNAHGKGLQPRRIVVEEVNPGPIVVDPLPRPPTPERPIVVEGPPAAPPAPGAIPQAGAGDPPTTIVHVCSSVDPALYATCRQWRARMADPEQCKGAKLGLKVLPLDDPTPAELGAVVKRLPQHTPVILDGHGAMLRKDLRKPAGPGNPEVHHMPIPQGKGKYGRIKIRLVPADPTSVAETDLIETEGYKQAIEGAGTGAGTWVATCMAGGACKPGDKCSGGACRADEYSVSFGSRSEFTVEEIGRLLCDPKSFDKKTVLSPEDLSKDFCSKVGGALVEPLNMFVAKKVADWESPLESDVNGNEIKVTPVADEGEIDDVVAKKKKAHADKVVLKKPWGKTFRLRYKDGDGKVRTATVEGMVFKTEKGARASLDESNPGWAKDCAALVYDEEQAKTLKATDCSVEETGSLFSVEVREKTGSCVADPRYAYHPQVNTFALHSPYHAPGAARWSSARPASTGSHSGIER